MTKSVSYGHTSTAVGGVSAVAFPVAPLNYDADFGIVEEGPGKVVMTSLVAPQDQPFVLTIAQRPRANVYAGTSIDPSVFLPNKKGTDTMIEIKAVGKETDSTDSTYERLFPVRFVGQINVPDASQVTAAAVISMLEYVIAALAIQGDDEALVGTASLLHGVVART